MTKPRFLIVIPARGGSKGIPLKNIVSILGKPLLSYTIDVALGANFDAKVVVSTDHESIAAIALKYENVEVIPRPEEISGDKASTESALIHALDYLASKKQEHFDFVITLQATSPLRSAQTLNAFIEHFIENSEIFDAQLSLTENFADHWTLDSDGHYVRLFPQAARRRQDRPPLFIENSAYYVTAVDSLQKCKSVLGFRPNGFLIDEIESIDINEPTDLELATYYLNKKYEVKA